MRKNPSPITRNRPRPERTSSVTRVVKPVSHRISKIEQPIPSSSQFIMTSNIPSMPDLDNKKESSSLFKENQRLKAENARLQESLNKMQEELQSRDVFAKTLSSFDNERYDARRLAMYRAKAFKQERMIELLTTALESQKGLYFEIDTLIRSILEISKRTEKADENLISIHCLVTASKKKLREVEKNIKIAYSSLISSTTDSAPVYDTEIDISHKLTLKLDGRLILEVMYIQTEQALSDLLADLQDEFRTLDQEKVRIAAQKLLALGLKLPMGRVADSDQLITRDERRILTSETNQDSKRIIKAVLNRFYQYRKQLQLEISAYSKEAEQNKRAYLDLKRRMEQNGSLSLLQGSS